MNRRDFLLLKVSPTGKEIVLSCEALYMRFLDARSEGTTPQLFQNLADDLGRTRDVRLTETSWLSDEVFRSELEPLLETFRRQGGHVQS